MAFLSLKIFAKLEPSIALSIRYLEFNFVLAPKSRTIDSPFIFGHMDAIDGRFISDNVFKFNRDKDIQAPVLPNESIASELLSLTNFIASAYLKVSLIL